jgi:uncharacterized protein YgfB (UPF0149 family)
MAQEFLSLNILNGLLDILNSLDTVINEVTVVVALDILSDVKTILNQTTEVEEFFIIVLLKVLDDFNSLLNNFGVFSNIVNSLLGTVFNLVSVVINVVFSNLNALFNSVGTILDISFNLVDGIVEVEEFFIIMFLDVLDGLDTVVNEATVVLGLDITIDVKTVVDEVSEVEEGFIGNLFSILGLVVSDELFDFFNSLLDDFGVLSNVFKGLLGSLSSDVLVASSMDDFINSLLGLLDGFGVLGNVITNLSDSFFGMVDGVVDVEEFFIIVMLDILNGLDTILDGTNVVASLDILVDVKAILGNVFNFTNNMSDILDGLAEVEEFLVFVVQEFGGGGDDLRVLNNELSSLLKTVSDALEDVEFIINFVVVLGEDLDEFNSLLNNFRVSFNIVDSLLDTFFGLVDGIVKVEKFFIIVMLNILNSLDTMLDGTEVVASLDILVDVKAILGDMGDFTSNMSNILDGLAEVEEFLVFVVQEFGSGGDNLGVLNNELSSLLKTVSDALEDVEFIIIVVGDRLDEVNSLNNEFRVRDGIISSLLGILLDGAQDVEFFIGESHKDGSFGESGSGSVDGDSGLNGVVDSGVIDGHLFIIQEFGSGGDDLRVLNDELSSLLNTVSDVLEDVEFVFDFIISSKDLDGSGDNLGVLNNEFTSFLDISLEGAPEVEFIITDFIISGEDLGGGGDNLRVFNDEVGSLLDAVTEALEEVKFIITDFIVSVEDLDGSVDEFGVLNNEVTSLLGIVSKSAPEVEFVFRDFVINSEDLDGGGDDLRVRDNELTSFLDVVSEGLEEVELVVFHSFRSQREGSNSSNSEGLLHFGI